MRLIREDYFVSHSAPTAGAMFYSVPKTSLKPHEAFDQLTAGSYKILLKRLERHHDGFRDLLDTLFAQVKGQLQRNRVPRRGRAAGIIGLHQRAAGDDAVPFRPRSQFLQPRSKARRSIISTPLASSLRMRSNLSTSARRRISGRST